MEAFETTVLNHLLTRMQKIEVGVDREGRLMLDDKLRQDIAPDLIKSVEAAIQAEMNIKTSKSGSGGFAGVIQGEHAQNFEYLGSDDVTWANEGSAVVPKTVKFYQANASTMHAIERIRSTKILATGSQVPLKSDATFVELTKTPAQYKTIYLTHPNVVISKAQHIAGSNADIESNSKAITVGKVWTDKLTVLPDRVKFTVHFSAREVHGNHTVLEGSADYEIPAPPGHVLEALDEGAENHAITLTLSGPTNGDVEADRSATGTWHKDYHSLTQEPHNSKSILREVLVCLDGGGADDGGHANLSAKAIIPVRAKIAEKQEKEEIRPRD